MIFVCRFVCMRVCVCMCAMVGQHTHTHSHNIRICSVMQRRSLSARRHGRLECAMSSLLSIPRSVTPTRRWLLFRILFFSHDINVSWNERIVFFLDTIKRKVKNFITSKADTNTGSGLHFLFPFSFPPPFFFALALTCTLSS